MGRLKRTPCVRPGADLDEVFQDQLHRIRVELGWSMARIRVARNAARRAAEIEWRIKGHVKGYIGRGVPAMGDS